VVAALFFTRFGKQPVDPVYRPSIAVPRIFAAKLFFYESALR
jgi:hypothetical protein